MTVKNEWTEKRDRRGRVAGILVIGTYGNGMHDFIMRECEIGYRVAAAEEDELVGFGPLLDVQLASYSARHFTIKHKRE